MAVKKQPNEVEEQITERYNRENLVVRAMDTRMEAVISRATKSAKDNWQPSQILPHPYAMDEVSVHYRSLFLEQTIALPLPILFALVGNDLTEEALPTYSSLLSEQEVLRGQHGRDEGVFPTWRRKWNAEEARHGDVLSKYQWLHPFIDSGQVEISKQELIEAGFNPLIGQSIYNFFIYTAFQERATKQSHQRTGTLAGESGDSFLKNICLKIQKDEAIHEVVYASGCEFIYDDDPDGALIAHAEMYQKGIVMPGEHMGVEGVENVFSLFMDVAQVLEIYTAKDYHDNVVYFNNKLGIETRSPGSDEAKRAQEYLLGLPTRLNRVAEMRASRTKMPTYLPWVSHEPGPISYSIPGMPTK